MREEKFPSLTWPKREVQREWGLLARCLTDPTCLHFQSPEDQGKLLELASVHRVGPLLYHRLKMTDGLDGVSDHVGYRLRQMYLRAAAFNLVLGVQLSPICQAFADAELPVILVKGVVLASNVYPDPALRPMSDIDFIVRPEHGNKAAEVLKRLGYVPNQTEAFGSFAQVVQHARAYQRPGYRGFSLELHRGLASEVRSAPPIEENWFWAHTISVPINGRPVFTLSAEASLIHLCVHLVSHHGWAPGFIWLYDIHALLEKFQESFGWEKFTRLVDRLNWEAYCGRVLQATRTLLHSPLPETVLADLSQRNPKLWILGWQTRWPPTWTFRWLADWRRVPNLLGRLRFLWHTVFPSRDYMLNRYQPAECRIWPLLYPYRWSIMVRDLVKTIGELWRQDRTL